MPVTQPDVLVTIEYPIPNPTKNALGSRNESVASGNWSSAGTWSAGHVPTTGERVTIAPTHTVTYDVNSSTALTAVHAFGGTLRFRTDMTTKLVTDTLCVSNGGLVEIGTTTTPVGSSFTATVEIPLNNPATGTPLDATNDPNAYWHGILVIGNGTGGSASLVACGQAKTAYVRCDVEPLAGATNFHLGTAVTNWAAGDEVYCPDSRHLGGGELAPSFVTHREVKSITSMTGATQVNVSALAFDHPAARDMDGVITFYPHLGNLTRNVVFRSATGADGDERGTLMFVWEAYCNLHNVRVENFGRSEVANFANASEAVAQADVRAAVRFRECRGPDGLAANVAQGEMVGCVVVSPADFEYLWGVSVDGGAYLSFIDCIVFGYSGYAYGIDLGTEYEVLLERCWGTVCVTTDFNRIDHQPHSVRGRGFYITSPMVRVRDCVATECHQDGVLPSYGYGLAYFSMSGFQLWGPRGVFTTKGSWAAQTLQIYKEPFKEFNGFETYGCARIGEMWFLGAPENQPGLSDPTRPTTLANIRAWHWFGDLGWFGYPCFNVTWDGIVTRQRTDRQDTNHFIQGDYTCYNLEYRNCDFQGGGTAVPIGTNMLGSTFTIRDSTFRTTRGIQVPPTLTSSAFSQWMGDRIVRIRNCDFLDIGGGQTMLTAFFYQQTSDISHNVRALVDIRFLDGCTYNGVPMGDKRLWCGPGNTVAPAVVSDQSKNAIMEASVIANFTPPNPSYFKVLGTEEAGTTNLYNLQTHGYCTWGAIMPDTAVVGTSLGIDGYITAANDVFVAGPTVSPAGATIHTLQTQQFQAAGFTGGAVTWSVQSGGGTINGSGLYTPNAAGTKTIKATGVSVPSETATQTLTVVAAVPAVAPATATITTTQTQQYTADQFTGGAVTWSVASGDGSISAGGLYTPGTVGSKTIRATGVSVPSEVVNATLTVAATSPNFVDDTWTGTDGTAATAHTGETGATWTQTSGNAAPMTIVGNALQIGGTAAFAGTIAASGTPPGPDYDITAVIKLAAGTTPQQIGLDGRVADGNNRYEAWLDFAANTVELWKKVAGAWVRIGLADWQLFDADVVIFRLQGNRLRVLVNGNTRLSVTDTAFASAGTVALVGAMASDGTAHLWVNRFTAGPVGTAGVLTVLPSGQSIGLGQTQQFAAWGFTNGSVTWSVDSGGGSISAAGIYTPASAGTVTVRATGVTDTGETATQTLTVTGTPTQKPIRWGRIRVG